MQESKYLDEVFDTVTINATPMKLCFALCSLQGAQAYEMYRHVLSWSDQLEHQRHHYCMTRDYPKQENEGQCMRPLNRL